MEKYIPLIVAAISGGGITLLFYYLLYGKRKFKQESSRLDKDAFENQEYIRNKSVEVISKATNRILELETKVLELTTDNYVTLAELLELVHISEQHFSTCSDPEGDYKELVKNIKSKYNGSTDA